MNMNVNIHAYVRKYPMTNAVHLGRGILDKLDTMHAVLASMHAQQLLVECVTLWGERERVPACVELAMWNSCSYIQDCHQNVTT